VALIGILASISFPSATVGIDSLRLNAATTSIASFFNSALNRAERRQQIVEITIARSANIVSMRSSEPGFYRELAMPDGVSIVEVLPKQPDLPDAVRRFLVYPGGTVPAIGIEVMNRRGVRRIVQVDAATGVPVVARVNPQ
jgi:hypothetical protein